jgi:xylulokinase
VGPGQVVGVLSREAATETGLRAGLPVVAAGGDGQVFAAAALMQEQGLAVSLGTSVVLGIPTEAQPVLPLFRTLRAAWPGQARLLEAVLQSGTYLFRWLVDRLAPGGKGLGELEASAAAIPAGSDGLAAVPHWWGARFPNPSPDARGSFLGLEDTHTGAHLYRSLVEGSTFEIRYLAERIAEIAPSAAGTLTVGGGGASSGLWLSVLTDVLNRPVHLAMEEPVAAGAALLAALGSGHAEAGAAFAERRASVPPARQPSPSREVYDRIYREVWLPYRAVSIEHSARLRRITGGQP